MPRVKRIAFKGDPYKCCTNTNDDKRWLPDDGTTCDPKYRNPAGADCIALGVLQNCVGADGFSDYCNDVGARDTNVKEMLDTKRATYCNNPNNFANDQNCRTWCSTGGKGRCDDAALYYCRDGGGHYHDDVCSCINSPYTNPQCVTLSGDPDAVEDTNCQLNGYWTNNQLTVIENKACSTEFHCNPTFNIEGSDNVAKDIQMTQYCGSNKKTVGGNNSNNSNKSTSIGTTTIPGTIINLPHIPGIPEKDFISGIPNTLIVLFIVIIIIALTMNKDNKNETSTSTNNVSTLSKIKTWLAKDAL